MSDFQGGAGEQILYAQVGAQDRELGVGQHFLVLPHGGNPTGPHKEWSAGATDEVDPSLQVTDNVADGFSVPFSFQNVFRHAIFDLLIGQACGANFAGPAFAVTNSTTISSAASGNKLVGAAGTFSGLSSFLPCHVWIRRDGATPIPQAPYVALSVNGDGSELTLASATAGGLTLTDVAVGARVDVQCAGSTRTGNGQIYAMIERAQPAIDTYNVAYGMVLTKLDLKAEKGSKPTMSFTFQGKDTESGSATFGSGTNTEAATFPPFNAGSGFRYFRENGTLNANLFPRGFSIAIDTPHSAIDPAGIDGVYDHSKNRMAVTGEFQLYANDAANAIRSRADARTPSSAQFGLFCVDDEGKLNGYMFWMPAVQYESTPDDGGGQDGIVMKKFPFATKKAGTSSTMLIVSKFTNVYNP